MSDIQFNKFRAAVEVLQKGRDQIVESIADDVLDQGEDLVLEGGYMFHEFLENQGTRLHFLGLLDSTIGAVGRDARRAHAPPPHLRTSAVAVPFPRRSRASLGPRSSPASARRRRPRTRSLDRDRISQTGSESSRTVSIGDGRRRVEGNLGLTFGRSPFIARNFSEELAVQSNPRGMAQLGIRAMHLMPQWKVPTRPGGCWGSPSEWSCARSRSQRFRCGSKRWNFARSRDSAGLARRILPNGLGCGKRGTRCGADGRCVSFLRIRGGRRNGRRRRLSARLLALSLSLLFGLAVVELAAELALIRSRRPPAVPAAIQSRTSKATSTVEVKSVPDERAGSRGPDALGARRVEREG